MKYNFLSVRDFETLEDANESLRKWLYRRGNGKISQASKKVPSLAIEEERKYLKPLRNSIYRKPTYLGREDRTVNEKSFIMIEGREYSVPVEYRSKKVEFYKTVGSIFIFDIKTGKEIARHEIPEGGIKKVFKRDHFRYKSLQLKELEEKVLALFDDKEWKDFVESTRKSFPRYPRDQYTLALNKFAEIEEQGIFQMAVSYCIENKTFGMKKLYDTYSYLVKEQRENQKTIAAVFSKGPLLINRSSQVRVSKRPVKLYETFLDTERKGAAV